MEYQTDEVKTCTDCGRENVDEASECSECGASKFLLTAPSVDPLRRVGPAFGQFLDQLASAPRRHPQPAKAATPEDVFFPECIGRLSFAVRYGACLLIVWVGTLFLAAGARREPGMGNVALLLLSVGLFLFATFYLIRHVLIARLRDLGSHGAWALLIFVPFVNLGFVLALLFLPGVVFKSTPNPFQEIPHEPGPGARKESDDSAAA